jgi:hypothetical protein
MVLLEKYFVVSIIIVWSRDIFILIIAKYIILYCAVLLYTSITMYKYVCATTNHYMCV